MASESEVRQYIVQAPGDGEWTEWCLLPAFLLASLPHDHSSPSLSGLRILLLAVLWIEAMPTT